ncbi:hypothetical protein [Haloarcula pellucida]|uniref:Uncharacterized protein n=1 Tax=Haloarcula pellucida TaxID=1427151 RepID=A0A830GQG1_9EURY|nr:hypothetical protein [Halomicroarcula pellucida]MBX0350532.1 hypothetical protein [Halomicroarcula pellucida]GGO03758.1 hypothetical protein GCM10009030_39770 [Halomicroarcula pellucida]
MTDGELVDVLEERGFRPVEDAGLPGGWATDGEYTVVVQSRSTGLGDADHEVRVYDCEAGLISIETSPVGRAFGSGHDMAIIEALDRAGYGEAGDE